MNQAELDRIGRLIKRLFSCCDWADTLRSIRSHLAYVGASIVLLHHAGAASQRVMMATCCTWLSLCALEVALVGATAFTHMRIRRALQRFRAP